MPSDRLLVVLAGAMLSCLVLGGGTRPGFLGDVILQLVAIPLLLMAATRLADSPSWQGARWPLLFCAALMLIPLLQLIPLPPELWTALPRREALVEAFRLLEHELPWMPISVSPRATWLSAMALLPPVAIFLGTLVIGYRERRALSLILVAFGVLSVFVGLAQVAEGPGSSLRFFAITNTSEAVGFFANRNHFAAALYAITLLAAAWAVEAAASPSGRQHAGLETRWLVAVVASFAAIVILVAAQAIARSRAGLGLTIAALIGALAIGFSDRRASNGTMPVRVLLAATALAVVFAAQLTLYRVLERFADDPLQDGRLIFARLTAEAARSFMPLGSGMGTFVPVYAMAERPEDALAGTYVNRAHNDVLELWLETGIVGPALVAVFLAWLALRWLQVWRRSAPGSEIDVSLARAAAVIAALIAVHSVLDYPLRTSAMGAILAFVCGLLIPPLPGATRPLPNQAARNDATPARRPPARPPAGPRPSREPISPHQPERWGADVEWPEEWR